MGLSAIKAGQAYVELSARDQKLKAKLEENRKALKAFAAAAALAVAAGAVAAAAKGIKAASSFEEVMNKFNVVFAENADEVRQWSDTFAREIGRSRRQIAQFLSSAQDLLVPLGFEPGDAEQMSKELTKLAVDLGSFNDEISDEKAMEDLQAALTGSGEVMKKYGVIVNETSVKQRLLEEGIDPSAATEAQKAWARFAIILEGTKAAQGDAERSAGSYANQMKRLEGTIEDVSASFGAVLLPAVTEFISFINESLVALPEFIRQHETLITVLFGVAVAVGAVTTALILYSRAARIAQAMSGPKGWATLGLSILAAAGAAALFNGELDDIAKKLEESQREQEKLNKAQKEGLPDMPGGDGGPTLAEQKRAEQLQNQIRTPKEKLAADLEEIRALMAKNLLPSDFAARFTRFRMQKHNRQQSPSQVRRESAVDLRSSAGQSLLLKVLNGDKSIEEKTLAETAKVAANTKKIDQKFQGATV